MQQHKINVQVLYMNRLEKKMDATENKESTVITITGTVCEELDGIIEKLDVGGVEMNKIEKIGESIEELERYKQEMNDDLHKLEEQLETLKLAYSEELLTIESKAAVVYPELGRRDGRSEPNRWNNERERCKGLRIKYMEMKQEIKQLRRLRINVDMIRKMFGCSMKSLIPFGLNDNALLKYGRLFDGYYRKICKFDEKDLMVPLDVMRLISFYYPIFWDLT